MLKETKFSILHTKDIDNNNNNNNNNDDYNYLINDNNDNDFEDINDDINNDNEEISSNDDNLNKEVPPFPTTQIFFLCLGMLAHSVIFTSPLPYIAYMIVDFGEAENLDTAGYRAGWITGMFMIGRAIAGIPWGLAADNYGRKITLASSMFNVCLFGLLFGFSSSFIMAISLRFCIGLGNGFMGIAKTVISEITYNKEQEIRAFGLVNGIWGLGLIVGPSIGGLLSRPAIQYPSIFSEDSLFGKYPYLLPSMVCSFFALSAGLGITFFLNETLKKKENEQKSDNNTNIVTKIKKFFNIKEYNEVSLTDIDEENDGIELIATTNSSTLPKDTISDINSPPILTSEKPNTFSGILKSQRVQLLFIIYLTMCFIIMFIDENFPLYCLTSIKRGGLSLNNIDIGLLLGSIGIVLIIFQLFIYDRFIKYFFEDTPNNKIYYCLMTFVSISIIIFPIVISISLYFFMNYNENVTPRKSLLLKIIVVCTWIFFRIPATSAFTILAMMINSSVDSSIRGTLNGLMMTAGSTGNGLGPIIGSAIYAYFVDINYNFNHSTDSTDSSDSTDSTDPKDSPTRLLYNSVSYHLSSIFNELDNETIEESLDDDIDSITFGDYSEAKHYPIDGRFVFIFGGIVIFGIALLTKYKVAD